MSALKSTAGFLYLIGANLTHAESHPTIQMPVFNQAYQENYKADSMKEILENARGAYILLEPLQDNISMHVAALKATGNQVSAYTSIGTAEIWRSDFVILKPYIAEKQWAEWQGEYFISQITPQLVEIMKTRIDKFKEWGFEWIEFDNMDWLYDEQNRIEYKLEATFAQSITYLQNLCTYVHQQGMKCMAKNLSKVSNNFDGILYESYSDEKNWWDVQAAQNFFKNGKLFIINHYNELNCDQVYAEYRQLYGNSVSFICEDFKLKAYRHYNLVK